MSGEQRAERATDVRRAWAHRDLGHNWRRDLLALEARPRDRFGVAEILVKPGVRPHLPRADGAKLAAETFERLLLEQRVDEVVGEGHVWLEVARELDLALEDGAAERGCDPAHQW